MEDERRYEESEQLSNRSSALSRESVTLATESALLSKNALKKYEEADSALRKLRLIRSFKLRKEGASLLAKSKQLLTDAESMLADSKRDLAKALGKSGQPTEIDESF